MSTFDLEEQERLDELKAWWKRWGNTAVIGASIVVAAFAGWRWWQHSQLQAGYQAASLYENLRQHAANRELKAARDAGGLLMDEFKSTAYAPRGALLLARVNVEAGDLKSAKAQLQWVIDHSKEDALADAARLRLASLLLEEKQPAEALKLAQASHDAAFDGLYADLAGDALLAQNKPAEARAAYARALEKLDAKSGWRRLVEIKLDALGGPVASGGAAK
jgi:predicted negative regulator of RcsB-dependent stress response